jgi:predicted nucleic-acid-binding protein
MIGLDANVVVRYLTQDDALQSARATTLIEGLTEANPGFISVVAMVETAWVLKSSYGFPDRRIAAAIEGLLKADTLLVEDEREVSVAMMALKRRQGSFADALIAALGAKAGCSVTYTFDRKAARLPGFAQA